MRLKFRGSGFLILASCFLLLNACRFNDRKTLQGTAWLQGVWQQQVQPADTLLVSHSVNSYRFSCDSVFVTMRVFSSADTSSNRCEGKGRWTEYAVANYRMDHDTLHIKGFFAGANFRIKTSGCHRTGVYEESFIVQRKTPGHLLVTLMQTAIGRELILSEKTRCAY